jgi:hypothetical protein
MRYFFTHEFCWIIPWNANKVNFILNKRARGGGQLVKISPEKNVYYERASFAHDTAHKMPLRDKTEQQRSFYDRPDWERDGTEREGEYSCYSSPFVCGRRAHNVSRLIGPFIRGRWLARWPSSLLGHKRAKKMRREFLGQTDGEGSPCVIAHAIMCWRLTFMGRHWNFILTLCARFDRISENSTSNLLVRRKLS